MSQEFSRRENCTLGASCRLDDFLMNPLYQGYSGAAPETSWNAYGTNQGMNEDEFESGPHPEAGIFQSRTTHNSGPEDGYDMVTGVQKESLCGYDMVTGVHHEVTYCFPTTSSGKQKRNRSTSQPQFRSGNNPATIEADQILLALQQLASNNISANFHKNINRISKLPKSRRTMMLMFDRKSEEFDLFEDVFKRASKFIFN